MTSPALERFVSEAAARSSARADPADCVLALAPLMLDLIDQAGTFLEPRHYRSDPLGYARNLVYDAADQSLSLYSIVWLPGQWTPVHDHGSWGVVGVIEGVLEERSYVREMKSLSASKKTMVMQERLFFRNLPLSNWIEHEMLIEEGRELDQLPKESVFSASALPAGEGRIAISKYLEEVKPSREETQQGPLLTRHTPAFGAQ